jgi:kynureninase
VRIEDLEAAITEAGDTLALALLDGVNFATGQALPVRRLTDAGHAAGAVVGWQMAHGAGNVPLALHDDDVDFAVWCTYKYLNGGPGSVGAIFVHERHSGAGGLAPALTGWWGEVPEHRFDPSGPFVPDTGAAAWKMSTAPLFNTIALAASLEIFEEVGMPALRARSIRMTAYLEGVLDEAGIPILTPSDPEARGAQLSARFTDAQAVLATLESRGVIADYRAPDIIRFAPIPLYNSFHDLWRLGEVLRLR